MEKFILFGKYCDNAIKKREPFRDQHLNRLAKLKQEGTLITLGPTKCNSYVFGIFQASNVKDVKKIVEDDIYWMEGIWISFDVYPWNQAF